MNKISTIVAILVTVSALMPSTMLLAGTADNTMHSGRTASDGCHYDRKTGIRHCH